MATPQHQILEWESPSTPPKRSLASRLAFLSSSFQRPTPIQKEPATSGSSQEEQATPSRRRFDGALPPWLAFFGTKRKLIYSLVGALVLLILILGLSIGLTKHKGSVNLPLPTTNGIFNGDLTYYSPGPGYGACGYENTDQDSICALSHLLWDALAPDANPNHNPLCGKKLRITRFDPAQGRNNSVDVTVVDRCTGCKATDVDLSIKMFEILADEVQGRVVGTWAWL